jgi:release factor glutamine methyltransferase
MSRLRAADIATAALDADVLLAHVAGVEKEALYAHPDTEMSRGGWERYRELIERRCAGEPVAYLRGWKEFYGLRFAVDPRVLIPRPETETLVEAGRGHIAGRALTVADIGTGSGAVAIAIAVCERRATIVATDLSADALAVARANALSNGVADRVTFRQGDLFAPIAEPVDVVLANLPYLRDDSLEALAGDRTSLAFEPRIAVLAGADGLALIRRAVAALPRVLTPGGAAFFEVDPPQAETVMALLEAVPDGSAWVVRDLSGDARVVGARAG